MHTENYSNRICVVDPEGGTWHPSDATLAIIEAAENPSEKALEICAEDPMAGTWSS